MESSDSSPVSRDPPAVCPLRTAHSELGDLYVRRLARVCRHDSQVALGAVDLEQEPRPVGGAAFQVDRCDRAALEDAAYEHLVGRGHRNRLARLDDLNLLALVGQDAGQLEVDPSVRTTGSGFVVGSSTVLCS